MTHVRATHPCDSVRFHSLTNDGTLTGNKACRIPFKNLPIEQWFESGTIHNPTEVLAKIISGFCVTRKYVYRHQVPLSSNLKHSFCNSTFNETMIGFATPWNGKTTIVRFRQNEEPWQSMNCTSITIEGSLLRIGTARELPSCCQPTLIKFFRPFRHTSALSGTLLCDISRAIAFPVNISVNNSNDLGGILASAKNCLHTLVSLPNFRVNHELWAGKLSQVALPLIYRS